MNKRISTEITVANITRLTDLLEGAPDRLQRLSQPFSVEQLQQPLADGERSFRDVVAHLLHCEAVSSGALYLALMVDEPTLVALQPERHIGKLLRYNLLSVSDLLAYFRIRRIILGSVLASLAHPQWECAIQEQGKKRKETVYSLARSIAMHEQEHLTELEQKLHEVMARE